MSASQEEEFTACGNTVEVDEVMQILNFMSSSDKKHPEEGTETPNKWAFLSVYRFTLLLILLLQQVFGDRRENPLLWTSWQGKLFGQNRLRSKCHKQNWISINGPEKRFYGERWKRCKSTSSWTKAARIDCARFEKVNNFNFVSVFTIIVVVIL